MIGTSRKAPAALHLVFIVMSALLAACSTARMGGVATKSMNPGDPDPRVGLKGGRTDAAQASWNMRLIANRPSPPGADEAWNSDLAFLGNYVLQGNFNGFVVWDVANPRDPTLVKSYLCPASQSDVSVYKNLLFISSEANSGRLDCGTEAPREPVSPVRMRGIRIFDVTDIRNPKYIHNVQTCRGSHTHSLVTDPNDAANVYIYVSGSAPVRPTEELSICSSLSPDQDPNSSLFRIEVIQIPVASPQDAKIVTAARVFADMEAAPRRSGGGGGGRGGRGGGGGQGGGGEQPAGPRPGPNQCHDITTYPAVGLAGGACQGYGILMDIKNPAQPQRLTAVADTNFATWHSVTFNNDGTKVLWTDEWGGGTAPRCRATDNKVWGGDAIFTINGGRAEFQSYYKMPAAQTDAENCVAHNGSLVPIPGRDIKVQGWYQGGISIFEWTDPKKPVEIAFFDRGPYVTDTLRTAGSWSAYWYNGFIYSSEIERGLDVFELQPSEFITKNELDAAKTVRQEYFNAQEQQKLIWPPSFVLARAYLDQVERARALDGPRIAALRAELKRVEGLSGGARGDALRELAGQLDNTADAAAKRLAATLRDLAGA
jgi:uncharacterized membrane protein YgcG